MIVPLNYDTIVSKLKASGLSLFEIEEKIKNKMEQLSGLISKEGAAHIIANEIGIKVFEDIGEVKIKDAKNGMRNVNLNGKVTVNFGVREFKNEKRSGRVGSFVIGDETGTLRVVLWDDSHINLMGNIKDGDIIRVENGYVKENNGYKEIHLNNISKLNLNPDGIKIENVKTNGVSETKVKEIKSLQQNERVAIRGTVVQIFEPRFYETCSECGRKVIIENGGFKCLQHNKVDTKFSCVVNCVLDDGSESIRVACFREIAWKLIGVGEEELLAVKDNPGKFETFK
ncbi:MAG: OB-fold nucleic acid binding domain-containing protein, partial [Nanoarchaeota archaeon]